MRQQALRQILRKCQSKQVSVNYKTINRIERSASIALWTAASAGLIWAMNPFAVSAHEAAAFGASAILWLPLAAATVRAPLWMTRFVNDRTDSRQRLHVRELPGSASPKGRYLFMDA